MTEKKYPEITDFFKEGEHLIRVFPKKEWDNSTKSFKENSHKSGVSAKGFKWWMYSTKIEGASNDGKNVYVNLFANEKNKEYFDTGHVSLIVKPKLVNGEEIFDRNGNKLMANFFNNASRVRSDVEKTLKIAEEVFDSGSQDMSDIPRVDYTPSVRAEDVPF